MNGYRLTLIDFHLFGFFPPLFLLDRPEMQTGHALWCCLPQGLLSTGNTIWLADHKPRILGDIIPIHHLNTSPITKACTDLLEPVHYQSCSRSFKPGLSQYPPYEVTSGNALLGKFSVYAVISEGELPLSMSTG